MEINEFEKDVASVNYERQAQKQGASFGIAYTPFTLYDISDENKYEMLRKYQEWLLLEQKIKRHNYESDSLEEFLIHFHGSFEELISNLEQFAHSFTSESLIKQIKEIVNQISNKAKTVDPQLKQTVGPTVLNFDFTNASNIHEIFFDSLEKSAFFFQSKYGKTQNLSTQKQTIFDNASFTDLVKMFNPEQFYSLSVEQVKDLCQAVSNKYCEAKGVKPCAVNFADFGSKHNSVVFGNFSWASQSITLNSNFLNNLGEYAKQQNTFAPYELLQTIIHESHHRYQQENVDKKDLSQQDNIVKEAILRDSDDNKKTFKDYASSLDEKDARNAALGFMQRFAHETGDRNLQVFCQNETNKELNTRTYNVTGRDENLFPHLYTPCDFGVKRAEQNALSCSYSSFMESMRTPTPTTEISHERIRARTKL